MAASDFLCEKMMAGLAYPPTTGQVTAFKKLAEFMRKDAAEDWLFVLEGYAGTGKTTVLSAFIAVLKRLRIGYVLLAPTGRAAKVLSNFAGEKAGTIHKCIYRQESLKDDGQGRFHIDRNKSVNTYFIVDEVSLVQSASLADNVFGSGDLLSDLFAYVRQSESNKVIFTGDPAQLPPVGMEHSPALDLDYLRYFAPNTEAVFLSEVVRQDKESGILTNATMLRRDIEKNNLRPPVFKLHGYTDIQAVTGEYLLEQISTAIQKYGDDEVVVLCRSNARANRYNEGIRAQVLYKEEKLSRGDRIMVVKNCYQFKGQTPDLEFIANGDVAELVRVKNEEERHGLHYADALLCFPDYNGAMVEAKLILDTLTSTAPALDRTQQEALFRAVYADYAYIANKRHRYKAVREDPYFNALQIKYSTAITGHKSQGGEWKCVFVDNVLWHDDITLDDKKWLYTAITRSTEHVFLVNFNEKYLRL